MEEMQEDSEENYNKHFSQYIAAEVEGGDLEELMAKVKCHSPCNTECAETLSCMSQ